MPSQRNTGAFITGGVLGGLVGAAVTLWNTPKSGDELRALLSGGSSNASGATSANDRQASESASGSRFSNPVLSFVEKAAAPIVGVELGKLAKDDPDATRQAPVRASAADAKPPEDSAGSGSGSAGPGDLPVPPEDRDTHDADEGSHAHAADTDDLTNPPPGYQERHAPTDETVPAQPPTDFPDLPDQDDRDSRA